MTVRAPHPLIVQLAQLQHDVATLRDWTALLDESLHELVNMVDILITRDDPRPPHIAPTVLADRMRNIRAAAGLTRTQLARSTHISVSTLRNIERNRHRPSQKTLRRLLPALVELERALDALTAPEPEPATAPDGAPHP